MNTDIHHVAVAHAAGEISRTNWRSKRASADCLWWVWQGKDCTREDDGIIPGAAPRNKARKSRGLAFMWKAGREAGAVL